jgi:hypothetical protein
MTNKHKRDAQKRRAKRQATSHWVLIGLALIGVVAFTTIGSMDWSDQQPIMVTK